MTITKMDLLATLIVECPEAAPVVDEHRADFPEVLLHLLVADLRRFTVASFETGQTDTLSRCLEVIGDGITEGDDEVQNAIAVSFVEDTPWWDPAMAPFMTAWPDSLRNEAVRQREWQERQPPADGQ